MADLDKKFKNLRKETDKDKVTDALRKEAWDPTKDAIKVCPHHNTRLWISFRNACLLHCCPVHDSHCADSLMHSNAWSCSLKM